jgi:hypothetical protein
MKTTTKTPIQKINDVKQFNSVKLSVNAECVSGCC